MGYLIEEKESKELFTIKVFSSIERLETKFEYVWAYSYDEAEQEVLTKGLELVPVDSIL